MGGNIPKCPWGLGIEREIIFGVSVSANGAKEKSTNIVVGPICEKGDVSPVNLAST